MHIRKIITIVDEARSEAGIAATPPLRKVAAVAIVGNPFAGRYQSDLSSLVTASAALGEEVSAIALAALGPYPVESYGKGAVIGLAGEQEHGVALLTTVFGNVIRATAGGGKAWISSLTKRAAPGARPGSTSASSSFKGGSLNTRAAAMLWGLRYTAAVGPACVTCPSHSVAVRPPSSSASIGSVVA